MIIVKETKKTCKAGDVALGDTVVLADGGQLYVRASLYGMPAVKHPDPTDGTQVLYVSLADGATTWMNRTAIVFPTETYVVQGTLPGEEE